MQCFLYVDVRMQAQRPFQCRYSGLVPAERLRSSVVPAFSCSTDDKFGKAFLVLPVIGTLPDVASDGFFILTLRAIRPRIDCDVIPQEQTNGHHGDRLRRFSYPVS